MLDASKKYLAYILPLVSAILLIGMLHTTSPLTLGPGGILIVFILLYIFIVSLLFVVVTFLMKIISYFVPLKGFSYKKLYYQVSIIAFAPIFLLALNSIGQLELKDFALVSLLVGIACFYVSRRTKA